MVTVKIFKFLIKIIDGSDVSNFVPMSAVWFAKIVHLSTVLTKYLSVMALSETVRSTFNLLMDFSSMMC